MDAKRIVLSALVVLPSLRSLSAQRPVPPQYREEAPFELKAAFGTTGDWKALVTAVVEPRHEIVSDDGASQSRICFVRAAPPGNDCAWFKDLFDSNLVYQTFSSLSPMRLRSGNAVNGLMMKASALYTTGQVPETAIWVYEARQDRFHLVFAGKSPEVRVFSSGPRDGMLVTADWIWDKGETRWNDHRRDIAVYRYSSDAGNAGYRKVIEYTTAKKYGAEDTGTIEEELAVIEAKIARAAR